jgi:SPX domain protein involved in polyphosphate accumulation
VFLERKTHRESWKGEESVKERFQLPEDKVVPFLEMEYSLEQVGEGGGAEKVGGCTGVS